MMRAKYESGSGCPGTCLTGCSVLERIDLRHFKCFDLLKLPLRTLTLLSGVNASGKSSVLQVLVLLQQTMREHQWSRRLMLNGSPIRLGPSPT